MRVAATVVPFWLVAGFAGTVTLARRQKVDKMDAALVEVVEQRGPIVLDVPGCAREERVAAISGVVGAPFAYQGDHVEVPLGAKGGQLALVLHCGAEASVSFQAEVITPRGSSDSFFLVVGNSSDQRAWHLGKGEAWHWSATSPSMQVTAGSHAVTLKLRESGVKVRSLRLSEPGPCWFGHDGEAPLQEQGATLQGAAKNFHYLLEAQVRNPFPSARIGNCLGDVAFAFAALHQQKNASDANELLASLPEKYTLGTYDPYSEGDCYWALALVNRVAIHSRTRSQLQCAAMKAMHFVLREFVQDMSKFKNAANTSKWATWYITGSENHDAMKKGNVLLALQALDDVGRGHEVLHDGKTISEHLVAWEGYFMQYFKNRAREGLLIEVASPGYTKYSTQMFYNIRDLSRSRPLRELANQFISLYWADHAHDFMKAAGVRAGATARHYKYMQSRKDMDGMSPITWAYGWHDHNKTLHPSLLAPATSGYRPPEVVSDIARREAPPHLYSSRRPGRGERVVEWPLGIMYYGSFPSNILRVSWWTQHLVLGTMAYDRNTVYTNIATQNRQMGVYFSDTADRIAVLGIGQVQDYNRTGYQEITGITGPGCSVISRVPGAERSSGTSIFISTRLWNARTESGTGWIFVRSGAGFAAVRPGTPGWSVRDSLNKNGQLDKVGKFLDLHDMWAPIVIQTGLQADFASYDEFMQRVGASAFQYPDSGELVYTSLAGNVYRFSQKQAQPPTIDEQPLDLNPEEVFSSPYMQGGGGSVRLTSPSSGATLKLDFS